MLLKVPSQFSTSLISVNSSSYVLILLKFEVKLTTQLGKGRLDRPFIVKTRFVSKLAEQKIKEAGGVIKLVA
jgi:ribosomal protein L15